MTSVVHPAMQRLLSMLTANPAPDFKTLPIAVARDNFEKQQSPWCWCPMPLAEVREMTVPGAAGPMRARLYLPIKGAALPVVLYLHGGGWTFGSVDTHDGIMRALAALGGCAVLGVDYRLAPEHPFPAPLDDTLAVLSFIEKGGLGADADPARIAVSGDSAGANLALGAMVARKAAGGRVPDTAALFYGCYAPLFDTGSHAANGDGRFLLSSVNMRWYWNNFLGSYTDAAAPAACAPLTADLAGLPPLYLNAASLDPLVDDTLILSQRLAAAGVEHRFDLWPGVVHGFLRFTRDLEPARAALSAAAAYLAEKLNANNTGRTDPWNAAHS